MKYNSNNLGYENYSILNYNFDILWYSVYPFKDVIGNYISLNDKTIIIVGSFTPRIGDYIVRVKTSNIPYIYYYEEYAIANIKVSLSEETSLGKNYQIVVDCSGSMSETFKNGTKTDCAIRSVKYILENLTENDYFNIILFGYRNRSLYSKSISVNNRSIEHSLRILNRFINYNMGGTELLRCLQSCFVEMFDSYELDNNQTAEDLEKVIIILTDGQIFNKDELINQIKDYSYLYSKIEKKKFRIFSIGIGRDVDRNLIKEMSVCTYGEFFYAADV